MDGMLSNPTEGWTNGVNQIPAWLRRAPRLSCTPLVLSGRVILLLEGFREPRNLLPSACGLVPELLALSV